MTTLTQAGSLQPVPGKSRVVNGVALWGHNLLVSIWSSLKWILQRARAQQSRRNLRVCETVSLGEKRFVAVVQVDEERFLIGGSSTAVALLTRLQEGKSFAAARGQEAAKLS
jgi:flagellar biogenesis protein FliO